MLQFLGVICAVSWCGKCWIGCGIKGVMLNRKVTGLKWRFCFCFSSGINGTIGFILCIHVEILHFLGSLRPTCLFLVYAMCIFCNVLYICHKLSNYTCTCICLLLRFPPSCILSFNGKTCIYSSPFTGQPFFVDFRPLRMRAHLRHIPDICPLEVCPIAFFQHRSA